MSEVSTQVCEVLTAKGYTLTSVVVDPGGYNQESKFSVTLVRNGRSYTCEFTKGAGHRMWKKDAGMIARGSGASGYWAMKAKSAQRVECDTPELVKGNERNEEVIAEFNRLTIAIPPSLDEVLYSLCSDASAVRHGQSLEDFCGEFGYDADSRKAEKIFQGCRDGWSGLCKLGADLDALDELYSNY